MVGKIFLAVGIKEEEDLVSTNIPTREDDSVSEHMPAIVLEAKSSNFLESRNNCGVSVIA